MLNLNLYLNLYHTNTLTQMQYPPNTVPITAEEFKHIQSISKFTPIWVSIFEVWHCLFSYNEMLSNWSDLRIAAHDYRHYFGEVVDLKEYQTPSYDGSVMFIDYCGIQFYYTVSKHVVERWMYGTRITLTFLSPDEVKKYIIDELTALFKKDLPHLNIKFVWS